MLHSKENNRQILQYVLPSIAAMVVSFSYNMIDGMFVGRGVGANALAAVNITVPFTAIVTGIASMLAIGGAAVMAIRKGRKHAAKTDKGFYKYQFYLFLCVCGNSACT